MNNVQGASAHERELLWALERAYVALARAAKDASDLAKGLGAQPHKSQAYGIKNLCLSELVRSEVAIVNGVRPDGFVGLDIRMTGKKLHTKPSGLEFDAAAIVRRQIPMVGIYAPLSECLSAPQIQALAKRFPSSRRPTV